MSDCTCGQKFRDAEDFRDHLPCGGTPEQERIRELEAEVIVLRGRIDSLQDACKCKRKDEEAE